MTRHYKQPSADQLANLAVGGLPPRKAAKIRAHVAQCEECTRVCQQLNIIRAILASASYPPMPAKVSARIESAISREARQRQAAMPGSGADGGGIPARRPRAGAGGRQHLRALSVAAIRLVAAAGAVVIAAAAGYLVAQNAGTTGTRSSSPLAGAAAPAHQMLIGPHVTYGEPGALDTIRAVESDTNFVAAHLRTQVIAAVHTAEAVEAFAREPSASTAAPLHGNAAAPAVDGPSASRLADCIGLIAPSRTILLVDIARYQGKPAAVIVTAPTVVSRAEAWVVGTSCSATTKDVLTQATLGDL